MPLRPLRRSSALSEYAKPAAAAQKSKVNIASLAYCQRLPVVAPLRIIRHSAKKKQQQNIVGIVGFRRRLAFWRSCVVTKLRSLLVGRSFLLTSLVSCWLLGSSWLKLFVSRAPHQCGVRRDSQSQAEASSQSNVVDGGSESQRAVFRATLFHAINSSSTDIFCTWQLKQLQRTNTQTKIHKQKENCVCFFDY